MNADNHQKLADFIWNIADKLRGPYRPPQYRKVMLLWIVLRRLDCVLEATKDDVPKQYATRKKKRACRKPRSKRLWRKLPAKIATDHSIISVAAHDEERGGT